MIQGPGGFDWLDRYVEEALRNILIFDTMRAGDSVYHLFILYTYCSHRTKQPTSIIVVSSRR